MYVGRYYGSNTPLQLVHLFLLCICEKSLKIKIEILRGRCDFYLGILLPWLVTVVRNMIWFIVGCWVELWVASPLEVHSHHDDVFSYWFSLGIGSVLVCSDPLWHVVA